jgi:hypothetical protein
MALQGSGTISLADIQVEFGGSNPIGLNEYYSAAAGIPTSGTISIGNFYGASNYIAPTAIPIGNIYPAGGDGYGETGGYLNHMAVNPSWVAIGQPQATVAGQASAGQIDIFNSSGVFQRTIYGDGLNPSYDAFGKHLSMAETGDLLFVARPDTKGVGEYNMSTGALVRGYTGHSFTYVTVSASPSYVLAASYFYATNTGRAQVFSRATGARIYDIVNPLVDGGDGIQDRFGSFVCAADNYMAIHSDANINNLANSGTVSLFNSSDGTVARHFHNPTPAAYGYFGRGIAMNGTRIAISHYTAAVNGLTAAGKVYIYDMTNGALLLTLQSETPLAYHNFGISIGMNSTHIFCGYTRWSDGLSGVEVFDYAGVKRNEFANPNVNTTDAIDEFAASLDVNGNLLLVGAPREDGGGVLNSGYVYLYVGV